MTYRSAICTAPPGSLPSEILAGVFHFMQITLAALAGALLLAGVALSPSSAEAAGPWCERDCIRKCNLVWGFQRGSAEKCIKEKMVCSRFPKAPCKHRFDN